MDQTGPNFQIGCLSVCLSFIGPDRTGWITCAVLFSHAFLVRSNLLLWLLFCPRGTWRAALDKHGQDAHHGMRTACSDMWNVKNHAYWKKLILQRKKRRKASGMNQLKHGPKIWRYELAPSVTHGLDVLVTETFHTNCLYNYFVQEHVFLRGRKHIKKEMQKFDNDVCIYTTNQSCNCS